MRVSVYERFVRATDQSVDLDPEDRVGVAVYGVAAEVGSVVAAVKKRLFAAGKSGSWAQPNSEIVEELGDLLWYCFSLSSAVNPRRSVNILAHDIANLRKEIGAGDERANEIARALTPEKRDEFLKLAADFPASSRNIDFGNYQDIAFLTARTQDNMLVQVCLAVLSQLSAELLRRKLPTIEIELNQKLADRPVNRVLGEITWHIAALASVYSLRLDDIAESNIRKVSRRWNRTIVTPLHDEQFQPGEQLPRRFDVIFVSVAPERLRMYKDGHRLGNDLTDNAYAEDGYRYHDIMHLANAAKLGWSPVLRELLGRKRKSNLIVDEVEDGARARIVEEAVIKAIHAEGVRTSPQPYMANRDDPVPLFANGSVSFTLLKLITSFVTGLEVEQNLYWEWESAIREGFEVFHQLRREGQGTVAVDLNARTLTFRPEVFLEVNGQVAGLGSAFLPLEPKPSGTETTSMDPPRLKAHKFAVLEALGLSSVGSVLCDDLEIVEGPDGRAVSVKARGEVQRAMWSRRVVAFRFAASIDRAEVRVVAIAVADD